MEYPELETLKFERRGPVGWLINNRPDQLNAMNAHDARRVRGRVEGARRRPRGPRDRAHRRGPRVPDRRRRHRDRHRRRRAWSATASRSRTATSTSPRGTNEVWKPVITAVNGICAGGGVPLGRRRRHRDRGVRRAVLRPARVGRPGRVDRGDRADAQDAGRGGDAHGVRRPLRAHVGAAGLRARHDQRGRRPARAAARRGAGAGREDRARTRRRRWRATKRALWGALELGLTDACRAGAPGAGVDVGPPRPGGGPARVRREARAAVAAARHAMPTT